MTMHPSLNQAPTPPTVELWDIKTVVEKLNISKATIYRLLKDGAFPPPVSELKKVKIIRWDARTLATWIGKSAPT